MTEEQETKSSGRKSLKLTLINKAQGQRISQIPVVVADGLPPRTESFAVQPGVNRPKLRKDWDRALQNKIFAGWVAAGEVYELEDDINKWPDDLAYAMIERTSDLEGLRWWAKKCKVPKVQKRLDAAIEAFEVMYKEVKEKAG